jgi:hypothetical protein
MNYEIVPDTGYVITVLKPGHAITVSNPRYHAFFMCIPVLFFPAGAQTPDITDILMRDPFYTGTCEKKQHP